MATPVGGILHYSRPARQRPSTTSSPHQSEATLKLLRHQNVYKLFCQLDLLHYNCLTNQIPLHFKLEHFTFTVSPPVGGLLHLQLPRQMEAFYYKFALPTIGYTTSCFSSRNLHYSYSTYQMFFSYNS
ncbi:hypothetical protein HAX54_011403 [Datura stramonium]|uniref:Uncharacterized protein n=1 Tax=Datura stramonium TaxID=4076 RepID=A0ABS8TI11_DATST|nr:hypothetical protein [Datura stramonium]